MLILKADGDQPAAWHLSQHLAACREAARQDLSDRTIQARSASMSAHQYSMMLTQLRAIMMVCIGKSPNQT